LEVDFQQGNFKILWLLLQVLILFLVEKWIPPSRSKTAEIGQKTEGILGVKRCLTTIKMTLFIENEKGYCSNEDDGYLWLVDRLINLNF
jgi:hypothetical protein